MGSVKQYFGFPLHALTAVLLPFIQRRMKKRGGGHRYNLSIYNMRWSRACTYIRYLFILRLRLACGFIDKKASEMGPESIYCFGSNCTTNELLGLPVATRCCTPTQQQAGIALRHLSGKICYYSVCSLHLRGFAGECVLFRGVQQTNSRHEEPRKTCKYDRRCSYIHPIRDCYLHCIYYRYVDMQ